jgi:hypothetical protein
MKSSGQIIFVSRSFGMLVIQHSDGFAVVELLGSEGELVVGDNVSGEWNALEGNPVFKDGEIYDAYFQGNWGSKLEAIDIARKTGGG